MDVSATAGIIKAPESSPSKENLGLKRGQCISTMMQPAFEYPAGFFWNRRLMRPGMHSRLAENAPSTDTKHDKPRFKLVPKLDSVSDSAESLEMGAVEA